MFSHVFDVFRCISMYFDVSGTAAPAPPARRKSVARRAFNFLDKKLVAGGDEDDDDADVLIVNARRGMLMNEGRKEGRKEGLLALVFRVLFVWTCYCLPQRVERFMFDVCTSDVLGACSFAFFCRTVLSCLSCLWH